MAKPEWLRVKVRSSRQYDEVAAMLEKLSLHTVCDEANCPNRMECYSRRTATFMILGSVCTRNCTFCNVRKDRAPQGVDREEPRHVAQAAGELGLKHVVITSVTRDDLADGGAGHFADVIHAIRNQDRGITIEVLIPDFKGDAGALQTVAAAKPHVINHNIETVPRLYPAVRPMADYRRSLMLLRAVKEMDPDIYTKSGIMLGLGETDEEVKEALGALRDAGCDFLTVGQYLAPSEAHHPVVAYIHPDGFKAYEEMGLRMGFSHVASGPLVRSSYRAEQALRPSI